MRPILLAAALIVVPAFAQANPSFDLVPADAEFVISVNWQRTATSPIVTRVLEAQGETAKAQIEILKGLTGVDILKDIEAGMIWGRIKDDDSVVVAVRGRFTPDRLITLLRANKTYQKTETATGLVVHQWRDDNENKTKFGTFLEGGEVLVANRVECLEKATAARKGSSGLATTTAARFFPQSLDAHMAWAVFLKPRRALPGGELRDTLQAEAVSVTLDSTDQQLTATATAIPATAAAAQEWLHIAKGGLAILRLQESEPAVAGLARNATAEVVNDRVEVKASATHQEVLEFIKSRAK